MPRFCLFEPNDPRLEALHWFLIGATGSGKSFYTGLVLEEAAKKIGVTVTTLIRWRKE